jgi:hypothetical protein
MADIDLSFGSDLGPLLDNFQRLLQASTGLNAEVKKTATTIQVESRKSALEVAKIEQSYKQTSQVVAQINSLGLDQFTQSIQLQVQATEESVQANDELQRSADELVASLLGQGSTIAQQAAQVEAAIIKEAQALEDLLAKRLLAANPAEEKALNLEIAKQISTITTLKKKYDELNNSPGPQQQTEGFTRLQVQIREAEREAQRLGEEYGTLDERFVTAAQKAANLREQLSDVKQAIDAQNPEAKFKAFESAVGGVIGSLQTATGALQLFGAENERVQEIAIRLQGLFNFVQGVNTILSLKDSFSNLLVVMGLTRTATVANTAATVAQGTAATGTAVAIGAEAAATTAATAATNSFTAALLANPFTAILVAITAVVGALVLYQETADDVADSQKKINDELERNLEILKVFSAQTEAYYKQREEAITRDLALEKSAGKDFERRAQLELDLARTRLEAANASTGFYANELKNLGLIEAQLQSVKEEFISLNREGADEEVLKQKEREKKALEEQVTILRAVKTEALNAKNAYAVLNQELDAERAKRELENARGYIAARLEVARKGTSDELKARLDAIELEKQAQIDALGFNQDVEGLRLKIEAEARQKRIEAENDFYIAQLKLQEASDKARLLQVQNNAGKELELKVKLLEDQRDIELANLDLTERERLVIRLQTEQEISKLRIKFAQDEAQKAIELEKANAGLRLALAENFSKEQLQAQKDLITAEEELEIQRIRNSTASEEFKQQEILRIQAEAYNKREQLSRAAFQRELETEQEFIRIASDARITALQNVIDAENTGSISRRQAQIDYYTEVLAQIKREEAANIDAYNNNLISLEEYLKKKAELEAKYAGTSLQLAQTTNQQKDIFELLGLDLSEKEKNQIVGAANSIYANLSSSFNSYVQERQGQIDDLKAQNDDLIASINESIQQTQDAITQEVELAKLGYANNVDAKKAELEELKKQKQAALENDRKIAKEQQKLQREKAVADALSQASSLAVAGAQVFASESSKGLVGVITAISAITLLLSTFLRFKAQASSAAAQSLGEGGTLDFIMNGRRDSGTLFGKSHSHPSGGMRIEGTNIFVEGDEEVIRKRSARKHRKLLKAINDEQFSHLTYEDVKMIIAGSDMITPKEITDDLRSSKMEVNNFHTSTIINAQVEPLRKEMQSTREEIKNLRRDNKKTGTEITVLPDGTVIEKKGNVTNIITRR